MTADMKEDTAVIPVILLDALKKMKHIQVSISRSPDSDDLPLPTYQTVGSSGMDLYAAVIEDVVIPSHETRLIPTGVSIALPAGYEAQIRPRSGLALKHGITMLNTPGTIDSDYRGLISLIMINLGKQPFVVTRGMRVAQMVIQEVVRVDWSEVQTLEVTQRASGGFGSTGVQ